MSKGTTWGFLEPIASTDAVGRVEAGGRSLMGEDIMCHSHPEAPALILQVGNYGLRDPPLPYLPKSH